MSARAAIEDDAITALRNRLARADMILARLQTCGPTRPVMYAVGAYNRLYANTLPPGAASSVKSGDTND